MRPPAPITRQWVSEKNSFPIRGMAMYRRPDGNWTCNFELLRITRGQISELPVEEAAFEIAVSGLFKAMAGGSLTEQETVREMLAIKTARGTMVEVPEILFKLAKFMVPRTVKILQEGGGALPMGFLLTTQKMLLREETGSAVGPTVGILPALAPLSERVANRKGYEEQLDKQRKKNVINRRKTLAKFWSKNKEGFYRRGLVYRADANSFWQFNVQTTNTDPVPADSTSVDQLLPLTLLVARSAIDTFAASHNEDVGEDRLLRFNMRNTSISEALTPEIRLAASEKLAARLLSEMKKNRYGIVGLNFIERCLSIAWDPEDTRSLDDYPFPMAPSTKPEQLDANALEILKSIANRNKRSGSEAGQATSGGFAPSDDMRPDSELDPSMPMLDVFEDDDAIDQRAMALADHAQSAALRRIRDEKQPKGHSQNEFVPVKHAIDYAGLPKDTE